jgi:RNA polymerase sigma-70 factor (ECF subfamily)
MKNIDIEDLIKKVKQGDPNAFEPIITMFQQKMYSFCFFMLGNRQEAEDSVQEILFKAYRHIESYREDKFFSAWLYKIASNHCSTLLKRKKRKLLLQLFYRSVDQTESAEQAFVDSEGNRLDWFQELTPGEREILAHRVLEDRSFEEIGRIMSTRSATIRKRFERLKAKLNLQKKQREEILHEHKYKLQ